VDLLLLLNMLRDEALAEGEAFFVEALQLVGVVRDAAYLHGALGTDDDDLAPVFQVLYEFQLPVVFLHAVAQSHAQAGIFFIE